LKDYVLEKAGSKFTSEDLFSVSLEDIRLGPEAVTEALLNAPKGSVIIVNAVAQSDMYVFAAGILAGKFSPFSLLFQNWQRLLGSFIRLRNVS
jgi:hypothetical protein